MNNILDFLDRLEEEIGYGARVIVGRGFGTDSLVLRIDWPNETLTMQIFVPREEIRQVVDETSLEQAVIDGAVAAYKARF